MNDRPTDDPTSDADGADRPDGADEAAQDLRATSDSIRDDLRRLTAIEQEKLASDPRDPAVDRLSDEAVMLGERISRETKAERQLSRELG